MTTLNPHSARMTRGTGLDLRDVVDRFEFDQSHTLFAIPEQRLALGKLDMQTAWPMARFTTDVDIGKGCVERITCYVKVLLQIGTVTFRARGVPTLRAACPVQWIAGLQKLVDIGRI